MLSHKLVLAAAGAVCTACAAPIAEPVLSVQNPANPAAESAPFVRPANVLEVSDMAYSAAPPPAAAAAATGVVNAVDPARHALNINHQPIKALGWPSMTMAFVAAPSVDLSTVTAGDRIGFSLGMPDADGSRQIVSVTRLPAGRQPVDRTAPSAAMPGMAMPGQPQ